MLHDARVRRKKVEGTAEAFFFYDLPVSDQPEKSRAL